MASRYDDASSNAFWGTSTQSVSPSSSTQTGEQNTSSSSTSNQSTTSTKSGSSKTVNMDPASRAALDLLIQQLLAGGTPQMLEDQARRLQEIQSVQALRSGYSKEAAFADAEGAMNQYLRQAMENALPTLARAAEGAGTSANSMRALLTQEALTRASEGAANLGLQAAVNYGTLGANYSSILEQLTQTDPTQVQALLNALNIAKGAVEETTYKETGSSNTTGSQSSSSNTSSTQTSQNSGSTTTTSRGPAQQFDTPTAGGGLSGFSNSTPLGELTNAQWNALAAASGKQLGWYNDSPWDSYTNF